MREVIEEQATWATARSRFGELASPQAWKLVVEHSVKMCMAEVADLRTSAGWKGAEDALADVQEAERLETNLKHLQKNLPDYWSGAPHVQDLQAAMNELQIQWEQDRTWQGIKTAGGMPSNHVGFLSRDLQVLEAKA